MLDDLMNNAGLGFGGQGAYFPFNSRGDFMAHIEFASNYFLEKNLAVFGVMCTEST
jgi:hypothetical protein